MEDKALEKIKADLQSALRESKRRWCFFNLMESLEPEEEVPDWEYEKLFDIEDDAGIYPAD